MWPRRRRARPSTSYLCKLSVLVTLLLTMKAYRALHRCHPPAHTKLHGCSPVYVLLPSYIPYTPHPLTAHTHHRRQLGGLNRDVAGDSGVDLLVPGCAMWFSMIMWGTCVVFIPSKLTARGPTPLSRPSSPNAVLVVPTRTMMRRSLTRFVRFVRLPARASVNPVGRLIAGWLHMSLHQLPGRVLFSHSALHHTTPPHRTARSERASRQEPPPAHEDPIRPHRDADLLSQSRPDNGACAVPARFVGAELDGEQQ